MRCYVRELKSKMAAKMTKAVCVSATGHVTKDTATQRSDICGARLTWNTDVNHLAGVTDADLLAIPAKLKVTK